MKHAFEATLPAGYRLSHTLDTGSFWVRLAMGAAALTVLFASMAASYILLRPLDQSFTITVTGLCFFVGALCLYAVAHRLLHDLVWRLVTGRWCSPFHSGVPDVYVSRGAARLILLAPFAGLSLLYGAALLAMADPLQRFLCAILLCVNLSASLDDLCCLCLLHSPGTLMQKKEHARSFYVK